MDKTGQKLIEMLDEEESAERAVLLSAKNAALEQLKGCDAPNRKLLGDYQAAAEAYDGFMARVKEKYFPDERKLDSRIEALKWLKARGYKIGKSKLYADAKRGLLDVGEDGSVTERALKAYVRRAALVTVDEIAGASGKARNYKSVDRLAEVKAEREAFKLAVERGQYVPRDSVEREQAELALVLDAGLRTLLHERIPVWIRKGGGDPDLVPDAITEAEGDLDMLMREFSDASGFEVLVADEDTTINEEGYVK